MMAGDQVIAVIWKAGLLNAERARD